MGDRAKISSGSQRFVANGVAELELGRDSGRYKLLSLRVIYRLRILQMDGELVKEYNMILFPSPLTIK
jgi:hypothetical protein